MASFGENLRTQRELRGIELAEIARATKITPLFLRALEADQFEVLPGGLFARAFVRQYAAHIGLDVESTLAAFVEARGERGSEPAQTPARHSGRMLRHAGFIAGAGALGLVLLLSGRTTTRPRPGVVWSPALAGSPPSVYPPAAPQSTRGLALTLRAVANCWVEAHADGQAVLNRVLAQGETTTIEATQEILLSVGNAGGLTVSVDDQAGQPLGRSGEVRKNIRITRDSLSSFLRTPVTVASSVSG
jgi:cytoskeleton protein RodZ